MRQRHLLDVLANQFDTSVGIGDLESSRLAQMRTIAKIDRVANHAGLLAPLHVVVALINDVIGGLVKRLVRIIRTDEPVVARGKPHIGGRLTLFAQRREVVVVNLSRRIGRGEAVAIARRTSQRRWCEAAYPNRQMPLNWLGRELDVLELKKLAFEGKRLPIQQTSDYLERLVSTRTTFAKRNTETFEFLDLVADPNSEFEAPTRNRIYYRDILGEPNRIMERHQ